MRIFRRIDWPQVALVLGLATLATLLALYGPEELRVPLVGAIVALAGLMRGVLRERPPGAPPPSAGSGVILALVLALPALSGCGASALRTHAGVGTIAAVTVASTAPLVEPACGAALAECHGDADCVGRTGDACIAASRAHDGVRAGVTAYLDAIEVAALADEGEVLPALAVALRGLAALWEAARVALEPLDVELPALPPVVLTLLGGAP